MSDSAILWTVAPCRLLCPWHFPGKNTGVGCYFLLQGILYLSTSNFLNTSHFQGTERLLLPTNDGAVFNAFRQLGHNDLEQKICPGSSGALPRGDSASGPSCREQPQLLYEPQVQRSTRTAAQSRAGKRAIHSLLFWH